MESWEALGCPQCQRALQPLEGAGPGLRCLGCGQRYTASGQIPVLLRPQDVARFAAFSQRYREARLREGWQPLSQEQALALPFGRPPGYPALYWQVRRQTFSALMGILAREGPSPAHGPAADLGAGIGWLSYRLAQVGYHLVAIDASLDSDWGLGAAERYYLSLVHFWTVQGDLEYPPLQAGEWSLVVLNASLHYASDLVGMLRRTSRALRSGGRLIILDTPIARRPRPGTGQDAWRTLGWQELHQALLGAGLIPRWIAVRRGPRWWRHQIKAWLQREPHFSFPLIVADRL